jgi:hypothetical protein
VGDTHRFKTLAPDQSWAFPVLTSTEVLGRLDDPLADDTPFHQNCRDRARRFLVPYHRARNGGE